MAVARHMPQKTNNLEVRKRARDYNAPRHLSARTRTGAPNVNRMARNVKGTTRQKTVYHRHRALTVHGDRI